MGAPPFPPNHPISTRATAPPRRILKVSSVAEMLEVSRATVYALIDRGELEHVWVGNSIRVPTESLEAFVSRNTRTSSR